MQRRQALAAIGGGAAVLGTAHGGAASAPVRRVLHVMSFDSPWRWTDGQWAGFREALAPLGPFALETEVFQMDTRRHSSPAAKAERGRLALARVQAFKPDLVYLSDDDAVAEVGQALAGTAVPVVFSGVNRSLAEHGLDGAPNITGVLEREHVAETLRLLQALLPDMRRVAVVSETATYWDAVVQRVEERLPLVPGLYLHQVHRVRSLADYRRALADCERHCHAVLQLGILTLAADNGASVPSTEVQRWVADHVRVPDASFWLDRVHHGTLVAMAVSEEEQGRAAGRLALGILAHGRAPDDLPVLPTTKGRPVLSLARARRLGLQPSSSLLLSTEVVQRFAWETV